MANAPISLILCGISGRMGQALIHAIENQTQFEIIAGISNRLVPQFPHFSTLRTALTHQKANSKAIILDFSVGHLANEHLELAVEHKLAYLLGQTGLNTEIPALLDQAAQKIPIVLAPNTSIGANLMTYLAKICASVLPKADAEVVEIHHRTKKDSPCGTALAVADAIAKARQHALEQHLVLNRNGQSPRKDQDIGVFGIRGGNVFGEQTAYFFENDESISINHRVQSRSVYAQGALKGAQFLAGQKPGLYSMMDVYGLTEIK